MSIAEAVLTSTSIYPLRREVPLPSVLVVEDERRLRERVVRQLEGLGIAPLIATSGYEAIRVTTEARPELILLDGLLPEMHGFDVARFIRRIDTEYDPYVAMMTGIYKNVRYQNEAKLKYRIDEYLIKPFSDTALEQIIEHVRTR